MFIDSFSLGTILSPKRLFYATKGLSLRNKVVIVLLLAVIAFSLAWWIFSLYQYFTVPQPTYGGQYVESMVGQPRFINPLLARNSADRNLSRLVFGSLFSYDKDGKIRSDLAERFEASGDAKEFTVFLRQDVLWHDGERFDVDDILFTTGIAGDIAYGAAGVSSEMRLMWQDVEVERVDDFTVKFKLKESNGLFVHNLNFGILPQHIWQDVSADQFQLVEYNQKPIGTGPYEFVDLDINEDEDLIDSYTFRAYERYHKGEPFITKFVAQFYATRSDAVAAYSQGEVSAVVVDKKEYTNLLREGAQKNSIEMPHYFAVFFNQTKSVPLAYDEVREALSRATDRDVIIAEVFGGDAVTRYSPFADGVVGYSSETQQTHFDQESARVLLDEKGWEVGEDGIRAKGEDRLSILLQISGGYEQFVKIAQMLQSQWREVGVELNIQEREGDDLEKNVLPPRDYDAVLYIHQMRFEPDLLPLWHSKEKDDPGMNYALLGDDKMDEALENLIKTSSVDDQNNFYKVQQERLQAEVPAVFLFAPKISFMHSDAVKGIVINRANASHDRYTDVPLWYIKEKRVKKNTSD